MIDRFPITKKGYEKLEEEIKKIKNQDRPAVIQEIANARDHGDLSENAEYSAAREEQSRLEGRLLELEARKSRAQVIDTKYTDQVVRFGSTVTLKDIDTDEQIIYHLAGEYEADISKNIISIMAPIARALISKKTGDYVVVNTPTSSKEYEVLKVDYQEFEV